MPMWAPKSSARGVEAHALDGEQHETVHPILVPLGHPLVLGLVVEDLGGSSGPSR